MILGLENMLMRSGHFLKTRPLWWLGGVFLVLPAVIALRLYNGFTEPSLLPIRMWAVLFLVAVLLKTVIQHIFFRYVFKSIPELLPELWSSEEKKLKVDQDTKFPLGNQLFWINILFGLVRAGLFLMLTGFLPYLGLNVLATHTPGPYTILLLAVLGVAEAGLRIGINAYVVMFKLSLAKALSLTMSILRVQLHQLLSLISLSAVALVVSFLAGFVIQNIVVRVIIFWQILLEHVLSVPVSLPLAHGEAFVLTLGVLGTVAVCWFLVWILFFLSQTQALHAPKEILQTNESASESL